ncbi:hypothetical protein DCAR_0311605 [Daucus carota subsp. sativus]|uniref:Uncharacterized protein n=1 Tax=Daucus carota subsp. sativus TaxID=79200 RepID=A0AAF1ATY1_DAUCS|nr:hypothetical protein DCAR_0311605 [Daucus carota subsp. sativus]
MANTSNFAQPSIPKFEGNYDHQSMLMENLLRSKEYWSIKNKNFGIAEKENLEELKLKDLKAKNYLFQSIDKLVLKTII